MNQLDMEKRIKEVLAKIFRIKVSAVSESSSVENIENWDSLGHMNLVLALEKEFDVEFEGEQIMGLLSYKIIVDTIKRLTGRQ